MKPIDVCRKIAGSISDNPSEWKHNAGDKTYSYFPSLQHKKTGIKVAWTHPLYFAVLFEKEEVLRLFGWCTTTTTDSVQGLSTFGNMERLSAKPLCDILVEAIRSNFNLKPLSNKKVVPADPLDTRFISLVQSL